MESMIRKLAGAVDKVASEVGKLEKNLKTKYDKKAPKQLKSFMKNPSIIFDNYNKQISVKEIEKFLSKKGETVAFSNVLEYITKLKINNIFTTTKKKKTTKKTVKKATKKTVKKSKAKKTVKKATKKTTKKAPKRKI